MMTIFSGKSARPKGDNNIYKLRTPHDAQQEPQQKTVYREYNVKSNRFVERVLEPTEKSSLKYVYLPGLTLINQGQIIITMVKTEKGQYVPCKLIF
jgi:hypothetical protein